MQNNAETTIENTGIVLTVPSGVQEGPSRYNFGSLLFNIYSFDQKYFQGGEARSDWGEKDLV